MFIDFVVVIQVTSTAYSDNVAHFEALVDPHETLEALGKATVLADVVLKSFDAVVADDEPQLQGAEATAQRNTPVLVCDRTLSFTVCLGKLHCAYPVINCLLGVAVLQVQRVNDHGLCELETVAHPVTSTSVLKLFHVCLADEQ